jgi:hypothetical protein
MSTYRFVAAQAAQRAVRLLCRVLGVSRPGYAPGGGAHPQRGRAPTGR